MSPPSNAEEPMFIPEDDRAALADLLEAGNCPAHNRQPTERNLMWLNRNMATLALTDAELSELGRIVRAALIQMRAQ